MKKIKKYLLIMAVAVSSSNLAGADLEWDDYESCGGVGYEESLCAPSLTPYIALCTVAAIGIVAIAIRHTGHGHGHSHSH
jgi:hypothetical protein